MASIFYFMAEGTRYEPSFEININESLRNHFSDLRKFRFALHKQQLYSTMTAMKEFIKDDEDNIEFVAISDVDVANKFNQLQQTHQSSFIEFENLKKQLEKQKEQTNFERSQKLGLLETIKQLKQQLKDEHGYHGYREYRDDHNNVSKKYSNNISNSGYLLEQSMLDLNLSSLPCKNLSISSKSSNISTKKTGEEYFQNSIFKAGELKQFIEEEESPQHQEINVINDKHLDSKLYSQLLTVQFKCFHCNLGLSNNFIQTNCLHTYHEECLLKCFGTQQEANPLICQLKCLCSKEISPKLLQIFQDQIFYNQLNKIKSKQQHQYVKCPREYCEFFWINDSKTKSQYCPVCSEIIQNQ